MTENQKISRLDGEYIDLYDFYGHLLGREPTRQEMEDFQRHRQKLDLATEASCMLLMSLAHHTRQREMVSKALPVEAQKAAKLAIQGARPLIRSTIAAEFRRIEKRLWLGTAGGFFVITLIIIWVLR